MTLRLKFLSNGHFVERNFVECVTWSKFFPWFRMPKLTLDTVVSWFVEIVGDNPNSYNSIRLISTINWELNRKQNHFIIRIVHQIKYFRNLCYCCVLCVVNISIYKKKDEYSIPEYYKSKKGKDKLSYQGFTSSPTLSLSVVMWWVHDQQSKMATGLLAINNEIFCRNCSKNPSFDNVHNRQNAISTKWLLDKMVL